MPLQAVRERIVAETGIVPISISEPIKHILTHQRIYAYVWMFDQFPAPDKLHPGWIIIDKSELGRYPIPRLLDRFLEDGQ